jgi:hypothetical protein
VEEKYDRRGRRTGGAIKDVHAVIDLDGVQLDLGHG